MNFLRRLFGGTSTSAPSSRREEVVTVTRGDDQTISPPEEPVIVAPPPTAQQAASSQQAPSGEQKTTDAVEEEEAETLDVIPAVTVAGTRQLPPLETVIPKPGQRMVFGQLSDPGMVRSNNQDAVFSAIASSTSSDDFPDFGLFVVADGMGGHTDGEKASAITARIIARHVLQVVLDSLLAQEMDNPDRPSIIEILRDAVQKANEAVSEQIPEGGTTATTTVVLGDLAYIAHVGDSRAYLIQENGIEQITRDHSLVQRLIELDQLTPEEAAEHPQRNVLYRAIGQSDSLDIDAITRRLPPRSHLLLCSDGLWNLVPESTIREVATRYADPQRACDELVKMANDRGGPDNITVVLVKMPG